MRNVHDQKSYCSVPSVCTTIYTTALKTLSLEKVPIPILDQNDRAYSYTHLEVEKSYIALNSETYISLWQQELRTM